VAYGIGRCKTPSKENFTSKRATDIAVLSKDLFDSSGGKFTYAGYKVAVETADPVLYADAHRLWRANQLSPASIEAVL
jgi:hypothetical protein